jgi:hypothetical protein
VALDRYNAAAQALVPLWKKINWADVVEYAFLADFDLLRSTRQDVRNYPWATPAARIVIDRHFKMLHAQEEIFRLNIEIAWVVTYLRDEDLYLRKKEAEVREFNVNLAHQIGLHRMEHGHFNAAHRNSLQVISLLSGFSRSVQPGVRLVVEAQDVAMESGELQAILQDGANEDGRSGVECPKSVHTESMEDQDHDVEEIGAEEDEELAAALFAV